MLTIKDKIAFASLSNQLSPENLHCDGEISAAQARVKYKKLMAQWKALEKKVGHSVNEDETYKWWDEIRAYEEAERLKEIAARPTHPLLESNNPGVWSRKSSSGSSRYYIQYRPEYGDVKFKLYCNIARYVGARRELLGEFNSLSECVTAGDAFIESVTYDWFKECNPLYTHGNIIRELERIT